MNPPVRIYLTQLRKKSQGVINKKFLWMLHGSRGAVFSKRVPLVAEGKDNRVR
jgi:hypothetical protein